MMIQFMDREGEKDNCLGSPLWHAFAGGMIQMPQINAEVFYFVQGHIEHARSNIDLRSIPRIPPYILCRVEAIKYLADHESDEVYARIRLAPIVMTNESCYGDEEFRANSSELQENKPASFAKTLTQSDANNGGGFSVPRYCAETIFPCLDYNADPPVQNIVAKDVHGKAWKFRHIYRGTPRRHLLTTGWSTFVNEKKLVAGDSIVFLRTEKGDLRVGIRRVKREQLSSSGWNPESSFVQCLLKDDKNSFIRNGISRSGGCSFKVKVTAESVVEAATCAANGQPLEVVYYPRAGTPEFIVKADIVKSSLRIRWCPGMKFKVPFETEDSSRISWFMGTITSVQVSDPSRWPESPWRLLQVNWDEPDLLQNVKRVSPWLVELVSNVPLIHLSPFAPPRKKLRLPQHPVSLLDGQLETPTIPGNFLRLSNPFGCLPDHSPAGMQGARHAQFGLTLSDLRISKLQPGLFPLAGFSALEPAAAMMPRPSNPIHIQHPSRGGDYNSCLLTMGHSTQTQNRSEVSKRQSFILFGKTILTEQQQQMSESISGDTVLAAQTGNSSSDGIEDKTRNSSDGSGSAERSERGRQEVDSDAETTGQCKVFMESDDVGRVLNLSFLSSYEELCSRITEIFGLEGPGLLKRIIYRNPAGISKRAGEEPFSEFVKGAKRLTILLDPSSVDKGGI